MAAYLATTTSGKRQSMHDSLPCIHIDQGAAGAQLTTALARRGLAMARPEDAIALTARTGPDKGTSLAPSGDNGRGDGADNAEANRRRETA